MRLLNIAVALGLLAVVGCASATTKVLAPSAGAVKSSALTIAQGQDTVQVEAEYSAYFREELAKRLYAEGAFKEGAGVTLTYRFVQLDEGSRAARYMLGPIAGKGSMSIEILYTDENGAELARTETGGEISGGLFGGSFKSALDKAAKETAEYARASFLQ